MKYGVKIPFPDGEYLWETIGDSKFHIEPLLFETLEEAEEYRLKVWGDHAKVEEYGEAEKTSD